MIASEDLDDTEEGEMQFDPLQSVRSARLDERMGVEMRGGGGGWWKVGRGGC